MRFEPPHSSAAWTAPSRISTSSIASAARTRPARHLSVPGSDWRPRQRRTEAAKLGWAVSRQRARNHARTSGHSPDCKAWPMISSAGWEMPSSRRVGFEGGTQRRLQPRLCRTLSQNRFRLSIGNVDDFRSGGEFWILCSAQRCIHHDKRSELLWIGAWRVPLGWLVNCPSPGLRKPGSERRVGGISLNV